MLPDGNGMDLCRNIKTIAEREGRFIPVILMAPMSESKDKVAGITSGADVYLIKPFNREELFARVSSLLRIQSLQSELQIAHNKLTEVYDKLHKELDIVERLQRSFLPHSFPVHPELDLAARYVPSMKAGGDYHDVISVDPDHWGLVIADISGHGASAAVIMALTQMTVKEFSSEILHPSEALLRFNEVLARHVHTDHYITMLYAVLDLHTLELTFSSAGHHPLLHYSSRDGEVHTLMNERGFPILAFEDNSFDENTIHLEKGDVLLFFTDGIIDVKNEQHEFWGMDRLKESFARHHGGTADEIVSSLYQDAQAFYQGSQYLDDLSLMVLARKP